MTTPSTTDIRTWARANGHAVSDRGAIPASVRSAYAAANGTAAPAPAKKAPARKAPAKKAVARKAPATKLAATAAATTPEPEAAPAPAETHGLHERIEALEALVASLAARVESHVSLPGKAKKDKKKRSLVRKKK